MGKLFIVPTPIGNLEDMSIRAINVLKAVDLILAEDTRTSSKLLHHYEIPTPMRAHHMHNEHREVERLIKNLQDGQTLALITDAGTPGISDPGFLMTRACVEAGIEVSCLPGATAFVPALVLSGLPCNRFVFEGFIPVKKGRKTSLENLTQETRTMVFYESPHKILKTLNDLATYLGASRNASVSRELTKIFEETIRGSLAELIQHFEQKPPKGEFVIVVEGKKS